MRAIARYQDQDAAGQAMSAQRALAALQLETAATGFYRATLDLWPNISDRRASALALQLANSSTAALTMAESRSFSANLNQVGVTYGELITRCGQLVLAQQRPAPASTVRDY